MGMVPSICQVICSVFLQLFDMLSDSEWADSELEMELWTTLAQLAHQHKQHELVCACGRFLFVMGGVPAGMGVKRCGVSLYRRCCCMIRRETFDRGETLKKHLKNNNSLACNKANADFTCPG